MRQAGTIAQREVAEHEAGHAAMLHDVLGAPHHDRRDAVRLQVARDQADGLVAHRAVGHQQRRVGAVFLAAAQDFRRVGLHRHPVAAIGGRAMEPAGQATQAAGRHGPAQRVQREPRVAIGRRGVRAVVADMGNAQIVLLRRIAGIGRIELGTAVIGRARTLIALVGLIGRGGGDQRELRLAQRLFQRRERHVDVVCPAVGRRVADRDIILPRALHVRHGRIPVRREAEAGVDVFHGAFSLCACQHAAGCRPRIGRRPPPVCHGNVTPARRAARPYLLAMTGSDS